MTHIDCLHDDSRWDALHTEFLNDDVGKDDDWFSPPATAPKCQAFRHIDVGHRQTGPYAAEATKNTCAYESLGALEEIALHFMPRIVGAWSFAAATNDAAQHLRTDPAHTLAKVAFPIDIATALPEKVYGSAAFSDLTSNQDAPAYTGLIQEILELRPDWDKEGGIAPSSEAKRSFVEITAYLAIYLDTAEFEIDASDGGVALRWFSKDNRSLVSVDIRPSGHAIVVGTNVEGRSSRKSLSFEELNRVLRTAIDAGLTRLDTRVR